MRRRGYDHVLNCDLIAGYVGKGCRVAQAAGGIAMSIKQRNDAYFRAKEHRKYDQDSTRAGKNGTILYLND